MMWCMTGRSTAIGAAAALLAPTLALAQAGAPAGDVAIATLPRDLSPWGMFVNADMVVQAVLIGLAFASVVTWTVWLAKTIELVVAKRRVREGLRVLGAARSIAEAA